MFKIENLLNDEVRNSQKNSDTNKFNRNEIGNNNSSSQFNASLIQQQFFQHLQSLQQTNPNFFHQFNLHNTTNTGNQTSNYFSQ